MLVETTLSVYDESGQLLCTNISRASILCEGGWGGPVPNSGKILYPQTEPDYVMDYHVPSFANKLYRLTGDTNYLHIDEEFAANAGLGGKIIMQGLASFGAACRMHDPCHYPRTAGENASYAGADANTGLSRQRDAAAGVED